MLIRLTLQGIKDLTSNLWAQALTLAAVTLVTFLGGLFLLMLHNLDIYLVENRGQVQFQLYWEPGVDLEAVKAQWDDLHALPRVDSVRTFTPGQGLELLEESLGQGTELAWLDTDNPLPPTALVMVSLPRDDAGFSRNMLDRLKELPGVASVHYNPLQLDLARSWITFSHRVVWPLIGFMCLVLALVVGNTFKLSLMHRRDEIGLLRLVGATRWYIQYPLVVGGIVQALAGGILALGMLKIVQLSLRDLLHVPPLWLKIEFLSLLEVLLVLTVLTLVGMVSSWVAVRK